jgi:hypothetical protein
LNKFFLFFILLFFSTVSSAQLTEGVEKSWEKGVAFIPNQLFSKSPTNITVEKIFPVVIFMHGCTGIGQEERAWANLISKSGVIVILPDSLARPGRVSNCNPTTHKSTLAFPNADKFRQEEISYALSIVYASLWADKNNIFLMGFSEGGRASALSNHNGFKGKIITGWTCTHIYSDWHGIGGSKSMPVLAIAHLNDPWRGGVMNQARCIDQSEGFTNFTQVDLEGFGHATSSNIKARESVKDFLNKNLN